MLTAGALPMVGTSPALAATDSCPSTTTLDAASLTSPLDMNACDVVGHLVQAGSAVVEIPPPGYGVTAAVLGVDGTDMLDVVTSTGGLVQVSATPALGDSTSARPQPVLPGDGGGTTQCTDSAYSFNTPTKVHWHSTPHYRYNATGQRSNGTTSAWAVAVSAAEVNMSRGDNVCGFTSNPGISAVYDGTTTRLTNISATTTTTTCGTGDGYSTVGWGTLPSGTLAVTCGWYNSSTYASLSSDIQINGGRYSFYPGSGTCSSMWDLQSVMTHEFGHFYGLGHVSESTYPQLTMSTAINGYCETDEQTLGLGDLKGMLALYGSA